MVLQFLADILIALHMFCFAVGIGMSLVAETLIVPRFLNTIEKRDVDFLDETIRLVGLALAGLWVTGLALMALGYAMTDGAVIPALGVKLLIVTLLSFGTKLIVDHALPVYRHNIGHHLGVLTRYELRLLGAISGLSTTSWMLALGLGAIGMFQSLSIWQLAVIFLPLLVAAPFIGAWMMPRAVDEARLGPRLALR